MKKLITFIITLILTSATHAEQKPEKFYIVDTAIGDRDLLINEVQFSAKSYCFHFYPGDHVVFLNGDPSGACTEATLINLTNNEMCDVWCQSPL